MDQGLRKLVVKVRKTFGGANSKTMARALPRASFLLEKQLQRAVRTELKHNAEFVRALIPHATKEPDEILRVPKEHKSERARALGCVA